MWPYTSLENDWIAERSETTDIPATANISPEMVDYYIRHGQHLRAQAVRSMFLSSARWVRHLIRDRLIHDGIARLLHRPAIWH